jgi:hypothetical protein
MTILANGVTYLRGVDSVNVNVLKTLPFVPDVVGGYDNGNWPNEPNVAALFPGVYMIDYTVYLANLGNAADDEPGDLANSSLVLWMKERLAAGVWKPIVYTSQSNVVAIVNLLAANGIARSSYRIHSAHYLWPGTMFPGMEVGQHICGPTTCKLSVQCDGTQWTDHPALDWDESLFLSSFVPSAPVVTPPPPVAPVLVNKVNPTMNVLPIPGDVYVAEFQSSVRTVILWYSGAVWTIVGPVAVDGTGHGPGPLGATYWGDRHGATLSAFGTKGGYIVTATDGSTYDYE